ncbi:hypothetical protein F5879DRAFT_990916 [Lentinula edodes]|nr:hypothetical protein F5879DRAFT_990916 [Lentinula edodes]KAJ3915919.1 hypothetical protein F5877DRAFT_81381 [Lentinula edodes]
MTLPPELHLLIIDFLCDSALDLKSCSYVSHLWRQRAILHLFHSVVVSTLSHTTIRLRIRNDTRTWVSLENWDLLKESTHLTDVIQHLSFIFDAADIEGPEDMFLQPIPHSLPRLSVLEIRNCHPRSAIQYTRFVRSFLSLHQSLALTSIGNLLKHHDVSIEDTSVTENGSHVPLHSLTYGVNSLEIDHALFLDRAAIFNLDKLQRLKVQTFSSDCIPILQRFGTTLLHLELLLFPDGIHVPYGVYPSSEDLSVVSLAPHITSLTLHTQYHVSSQRTLLRQLARIAFTKPCMELRKVTLVLSVDDVWAIRSYLLDKTLTSFAQELPTITSIEVSLCWRVQSSLNDFLFLVQEVRDALPETDKMKILDVTQYEHYP